MLRLTSFDFHGKCLMSTAIRLKYVIHPQLAFDIVEAQKRDILVGAISAYPERGDSLADAKSQRTSNVLSKRGGMQSFHDVRSTSTFNGTVYNHLGAMEMQR